MDQMMEGASPDAPLEGQRIEEDLLGKRSIPPSALYGIRSLRTVECLSFSGKLLKDYGEYTKALLQVKKAAARANGASGVIPADLSQMIQATCDQIIGGDPLEDFLVDVLAGGGSIAVNMNINEVLANLVNQSLGKPLGSYQPCDPKLHVNASQSTADACHTAMRIALIDIADQLSQVLDDFIVIAETKSLEAAQDEIIGRTCFQDAMLVSLGGVFQAHAAFLKRCHDRLKESILELHHINLGGTVVGDHSGASPQYLSHVLIALRQITKRRLKWRDDLRDAAQNMDDILNYCSVLTTLNSGLTKIAKDLRILSSGGFQDIVLPAVLEGSSFFKGKINPVVPETLIQACCQASGHLEASKLMLGHGELDLNVFEGAAGINAIEATKILTTATQQFIKWSYQGIKANREHSEERQSLMMRLRETQT